MIDGCVAASTHSACGGSGKLVIARAAARTRTAGDRDRGKTELAGDVDAGHHAVSGDVVRAGGTGPDHAQQ